MDKLPTEILETIGKRMNTKTDVSRFRSVCQSWRSSIPPFDQIKLPIRFCINGIRVHVDVTLKEMVVYHLVQPANLNSNASGSSSMDWIVKVPVLKSGDGNLLHPLSTSKYMSRITKSFPKKLNLLDFQVFELARCYTLDDSELDRQYRTGVAISSNPDWPALMAIADKELYYCKLGTGAEIEKCTLVEAVKGKYQLYHDVIFYEGKFYAVAPDGAAVSIDSSLQMTPVASPARRGCVRIETKYYLVESIGELLVVEKYLKQYEYYNSPVKFKVYKLNAREKKWVEMESLGDRILFVGDNEDGCFSACAQDFPRYQKNRIYFTHFCWSTAKVQIGGVFNFDNGSIKCGVGDLDFSNPEKHAWILSWMDEDYKCEL